MEVEKSIKEINGNRKNTIKILKKNNIKRKINKINQSIKIALEKRSVV